MEQKLAQCTLCEEVARSQSDGSLVYASDRYQIVVPSLGCFIPGHSLVVPRRHVTSFAELGPTEAAAAAVMLEVVRDQISDAIAPPILAEHGTGPHLLSAACCSHAHAHVIPVGSEVDKVLRSFEEAGGAGSRISDLTDLARFAGGSYVMLSPAAGEFYVITRYRLSLLRGISAGHFIRKATGANR